MEATLTGGNAASGNDDLGVEELRLGMLRHLSVCTMASSLLALIVLYDENRIVSWFPTVALAVLGYATWRLARFSSVGFSALLVTSLWLILTFSVFLYPSAPLTPVYCLIILSAAFLLSRIASTVVSIVSIGGIIAFETWYPGLEGADVYSLALFLAGATMILAWLFGNPLTMALGWAWVAYEQAESKMSEARARQGELSRVSKSLNETLTTLEDLNRQLTEARAMAEEARRLKAEFAAAVSHELRTPLNLIIGFAEILVLPHPGRSADPLPSESRKHLQTIYRNACHLSNLVDDILDLSQIDAHRLALHKESICVADVITQAVEVVRDLIDDEGLTLSVEVSPDLPMVHADPTRIRQILINLLGNANRFTDDGGIVVRAFRDGHSVVISVADTGMGIPATHIPHVFEEFRQFGEHRRGGSGLGLSICKRLIELHGGNMWVESDFGQGSCFSLSLPLIESVAGLANSPSLERQIGVMARQAKPPTLVVVDHDGASKVFSRYLDNYQVESVDTVDKARKMLTSGRASALLFGSSCDVDAWRQIQNDVPALHPVAYCPLRTTGRVPHELGVADVLVKPVTPAQMSAALRRVRRKWRSIGIVEDHPDMADLLAEMVREIRPKCRLWQASDGREALTFLRANPPDVMLLDLLMPRLNGYELLHEMRRDDRLRDVAVIVISGAEDRDERVVAEMVGVTRPGGMTVGEAMACLKRGLDSLLIRPDSSDREP